jgi:hypothetical protein
MLVRWYRRRTDFAISALLGGFAFVMVTGGKILAPWNVTWLFGMDADANFIGWEFFRRTPIVQFPIGSSPFLGTGFSTSIVFTDSIPLLAIPFKFINFLLPETFQYFGFWLLVCFVMQSCVSYRFLKNFTTNRFILHSGSALFLIAPTFLFRLTAGAYGHIALCSQFLIIWSMDLFLRNENRTKVWLGLCTVAFLVHVYIFSMVLALFAASVLMHITQSKGVRRSVIASSLRQLLFVFSILLFVFWAIGGFMSSGSDGGDGLLGVSLTAFFDPVVSQKTFGWSSLLPDLVADSAHSENLSFLGVATIFMIGVSLVALMKRQLFTNIRMVALTACTITLFAFSLSPTVMFRSRLLFTYPLPPGLKQFAETFRTMGRFDWPLIYLLMALGIVGLEVTFKRYRFLICLLPMLIGAQVFDTKTAFTETRTRFMEATYSSPLASPKWNEMGSKYKHLQTIPVLNFDPNWFDFAFYADKWHLTSSAAGIARVNEDALSTLNEELQLSLTQQNFKKDTLYVLTNYPPNPMSQTLLDKFGPGSNEKTKAFMLDGFTVIAP